MLKLFRWYIYGVTNKIYIPQSFPSTFSNDTWNFNYSLVLVMLAMSAEVLLKIHFLIQTLVRSSFSSLTVIVLTMSRAATFQAIILKRFGETKLIQIAFDFCWQTNICHGIYIRYKCIPFWTSISCQEFDRRIRVVKFNNPNCLFWPQKVIMLFTFLSTSLKLFTRTYIWNILSKYKGQTS